MQLIFLLATAPLPYAVFIVFQFGFRQETLSNLFYFDFLTPLTFLLVGAMVYKPLSSLNSRDTVMAASGLLLLSVLILFHSHTHSITMHQFAHIGKRLHHRSVLVPGPLSVFHHQDWPRWNNRGGDPSISRDKFHFRKSSFPNFVCERGPQSQFHYGRALGAAL